MEYACHPITARGELIVEMAMDQRVTVMCLSALAIIPILVTILVFPASAQSDSDYWRRLFGGPYYNSRGYYGQSRAFYQQRGF